MTVALRKHTQVGLDQLQHGVNTVFVAPQVERDGPGFWWTVVGHTAP
jgi:hypothetical protein